MTTEPLLDVDDIQAHVIPGHGHADLSLMALRAYDGDALRRVLRELVPRVVSARDALTQRSLRKAALRASQAPPDEGGGVHLALTRSGLDKLGYHDRGVDAAFDAGMTGLSTGDPKVATLADGSPERAHPSHWVVGGPNRGFDVLVIIVAVRDIRARSAPIAEALRAITGTTVVYEEFGEHLADGREHFGFRDGISTPGIHGVFEEAGERRVITTRHGVPSVHGLEYGRPGQPLVWPGRFLVGPPIAEGAPTTHAATIWQNGSFLVFRRLEQDVARFYADTDAMAASLAGSIAGLDGATLRSAIVGRHVDGRSLMRTGVDDEMSLNHFFYANDTPALTLPGRAPIAGAKRDMVGERCPLWAHVRKVNPRDGVNDLMTEAHNLQVLRRGVPFGPTYQHGDPTATDNLHSRGLLFLAYQRNISQQFEQLNSHWMNQYDVPAGGGHDLLVGQALLAGALTSRRALWPKSNVEVTTPGTWVRPTGGAYLFAPSITALRRLASPPGTA